MIHYSPRSTKELGISALITSSRLVAFTGAETYGEEHLIVWDWKGAQLLFVRRPLLYFDKQAQAFVQELRENRCDDVEFIDDYRLLVILRRTWREPPSLLLVDTEKIVGGAPVKTIFHLSAHFYPESYLLQVRGMHNPSPAESLAPFYRDPTQRIAALPLRRSLGFLVFRVGALLELTESHEGSKIQWDEWKGCVVMPSIDVDPEDILGAWVFGCRLFYIISTGSSLGAEMKVFDFSIQGRANYLSEQVNAGLGGIRCLSPIDAGAQVSRFRLLYANGNNDGVILTYVSVTLSCALRGSTNWALACCCSAAPQRHRQHR